jgi:hypothetical protein
VVILASHLYPTGGHTALISNFIRYQKNRKVIVLITSYGGYETDLPRVQWKYPAFNASNVEVIGLDPGSGFTNLVGSVLHVFHTRRPSQVFMFNHPQDVVAVTAVAALNAQQGEVRKKSFLGRETVQRRVRVFFYHHADIRPTLGLSLEGCTYLCHKQSMVDDHPYSGRHGKFHIPLSPPEITADLPDLAEVQVKAIEEAKFVSLSIGNRLKFYPPFPYPLKYAEIVRVLLERPDSVHVHIGVLFDADKIAISDQLHMNGIDPARFVNVAFYPSLAAFIRQYRCDLFVCSFPIGGAMSLIEAMSQGVPVAAHRQPIEAYSELAYCPPGVMIWQTPDELRAHLASLDPETSGRKQAQTRKYFTEAHDFPVFQKALAEAVGSRIAPPKAVPPGTRLFDADEAAWMRALVERSFSATLARVEAADVLAALDKGAQLPTDLLSVYFDPDYYRLFHLSDVADWAMPQLHYRRQGHLDGLAPHPLIDPDFVRARVALPEGTDLLSWFAAAAAQGQALPCHPIFDTTLYLQSSPDVRDAGLEPLRHYLEFGFREVGTGRIYCAVIDRAMFAWRTGRALNTVPDVLFYLFSPDASEETHTAFSAEFYRETAKLPAGTKPLLHYITEGLAQGADFHALISNDYLNARHGFRINSLRTLRTFFFGWKEQGEHIDPHPLFDTRHVLQQHPYLWNQPLHPLVYYLAGQAGMSPHPDFKPELIRTRPQWETAGRSTVESFARAGFRHRWQMPQWEALHDAVALQLDRAIASGDAAMADALMATRDRFRLKRGEDRFFANSVLAGWAEAEPKVLSVDPAGAAGSGDPEYCDKPRTLGWEHFKTHTSINRHQPMQVVELADRWVVGDYPGSIDADRTMVEVVPVPGAETPDDDSVPQRLGVLRKKDRVWLGFADLLADPLPVALLLRPTDATQASWAIDMLCQLEAARAAGVLEDAVVLVDGSAPVQCLEALTRLAGVRVSVLRPGHAQRVRRLIEVTPPLRFRNGADAARDDVPETWINAPALRAARSRLRATFAAEAERRWKVDLMVLRHGASRWISNWADLATLLGSIGFEPMDIDAITLAEAGARFASARSVLVECSELLALALMLVPEGATIYVLDDLSPGDDHNTFANVAALFGLHLRWVPCHAHVVGGADGAPRHAAVPLIAYKAIENHFMAATAA